MSFLHKFYADAFSSAGTSREYRAAGARYGQGGGEELQESGVGCATVRWCRDVGFHGPVVQGFDDPGSPGSGMDPETERDLTVS